MSGEIKLRVWDGKKMYEPFALEWLIKGKGAPSSWSTDGSTVNLFPPDTKFLRYTGLKDKNGVEIYEGDILSVAHQKYLSTGDKRFYKNGYDNRVVRWRVTSHHNGWNIYNAPQTEFEVLGNIYEDAQLLEST